MNDTKLAERSEHVDSMVYSLQQTQQSAAISADESLSALEQKIAQVDHKMQDIEDQVQSVDGRLNENSPFSQMGDDNIIHGPQWIAGLPAENFSVQLAYTESKNTMYEIAQRYNFYLKDSLSYFEVENNGVVTYALLSGNYTTQQQALNAIDGMPRYIDMQQPIVRKLDSIQKHIAK